MTHWKIYLNWKYNTQIETSYDQLLYNFFGAKEALYLLYTICTYHKKKLLRPTGDAVVTRVSVCGY